MTQSIVHVGWWVSLKWFFLLSSPFSLLLPLSPPPFFDSFLSSSSRFISSSQESSKILLEGILPRWDVQPLSRWKVRRLSGESCPFGLFFNFIPRWHLSSSQKPKVATCGCNENLGHASTFVSGGPRSNFMGWMLDSRADLMFRNAMLALMLCCHHSEILNDFGTRALHFHFALDPGLHSQSC